MSSILLVDDDEDILLFTKLVLEEEGYRVETALTGREALEKARASQYDIVFLDYMLPDAKGDELVSEISHLDGSAVIFYLTGYTLPDEIRGGGVRDVLLKPFSNEALLAAVRDALSHNPARVGEDGVM